jgi:hypothetical protein
MFKNKRELGCRKAKAGVKEPEKRVNDMHDLAGSRPRPQMGYSCDCGLELVDLTSSADFTSFHASLPPAIQAYRG